jgi:hypothetical protein
MPHWTPVCGRFIDHHVLRDMLDRPGWYCGAAVWLCAAFVFPLHLGWVGAPATALVVYTGVAATLLLTADVLIDPAFYRSRGTVRGQFGPFLGAVALPAAIAFVIGHAMAPVEDTLEDEVCELGGFAEAPRGSLQSLDDSFDLTADCSLRAVPSE